VPPPRCFISGPPDLDVGPLVRALTEHGWEAYVLSDVASLGRPFRDAVEDAIRGSSAVIAIFGAAGPSINTAYEAGLAVGLGKPVISVVSPGGPMPSDLRSSLYVQADPSNVEAITLALDNLDRLQIDRPPELVARGRPLGSYADDLVAEVRTLESETNAGAWGQAVEKLMVRAIEASGAVAATADDPRAGFDIGVWSDDLDAIAANPVLVEIKRRIDQGTISQCLAALERTPAAKAALIISFEDVPRDTVAPRWPVLWVSAIGFLEALKTKSFAEVFRELRNRSVHGLPR
jgi:hypothetical protein